MSRGLTHPSAHVGKPIIDAETKKEYTYDGFVFLRDVREESSGFEIIRTVNKERASGALFMFSRDSKKYGIIYFARSVSTSSKITPGDLGMQYAGKGGATENLKITASTLLRRAPTEMRVLNGIDVKCSVFKNPYDLQNSILGGLRENRNVGSHIYDAVEDFFNLPSVDRFEWSDSFQDYEINELGKYLGELIIGVVVMRNKTLGKFSEDIFSGEDIIEYIVPIDPSFSGIDSIFVKKTSLNSAFVKRDGGIIQISSKLGTGAKASFFSNLLPRMIDKQNSKNRVIDDIVISARSAGITKSILQAKKGAKHIAYEYGIREFLGIDSRQIKNTYQVFVDAKKKNITSEVSLVMESLRNNPKVDKKIKDQLPLSITAAFSREMANRLNNDKESLDYIVEALSGKNFYQANLDINRWKKGEVYFRILPSGKSNVSFIGNKAAINDIDARQGLVNYELKYT